VKNKPFKHPILLIGFGERTFAVFQRVNTDLLDEASEAVNESGAFRLSYQ
jgi:hypothetical protein